MDSTTGGQQVATYCYLEVDNTCVPRSAFFSCCWYHVFQEMDMKQKQTQDELAQK